MESETNQESDGLEFMDENELIDSFKEGLTEDYDGYSEVEEEIDLELYELGLYEKDSKDAPKKEENMTFRLLFAIILSLIFMIITPLTAKNIDLLTYWWAPLIAAFLGALIGAYIGSIFDAFNFLLPKRNKADM